MNYNSLKSFLYLAIGGSLPLLSVAQTTRPNVIVILADDIGYGDLGCYGAQQIKTPAIDALAAQGVKFSHAYAPAATSSPSRYAMLTGQYAWRKNVGILPADAPLTISPEMNTLPKLFRNAGYKTGIVGKWHLGLGDKEHPVDFNGKIRKGPLAIGFDYAYYFPATNDRVPCVFIENETVAGLDPNDPITVSYKHKVGTDPTGKENPAMLRMKPHLGHDATIVDGISRIGWMSGGNQARWKDEEMAQQLLGKAISFIENETKQPFFLYYAPQEAHEPRVPSARFRNKSEAGLYGDVIEEFDYCVGQVVEVLKRKGIYEQTLIVISSDNGPMIKEGYHDGALEHLGGHDPYAGLRGEKYSLNEGGTRVPFICSWPQKIDRPFEQTQPFVYLDLLATFAGLLDLPVGPGGCNDSQNASALFLQADAPPYRPYILTQNNAGQVAIRKGNWKYIPTYPQTGQEALYNLADDPAELRNLLFAYPQKANELKQHVVQDYSLHLP